MADSTIPTTKTLYKKVGDGPLKSFVPVEVNISDIIAEVKTHFTNNGTGYITTMLNKVAKSKGYTDIITATSYASAPNPFQKESQVFVSWQGAVWEAFYNYINSIDETNYNKIDISSVISSLPTLDSFLTPAT